MQAARGRAEAAETAAAAAAKDGHACEATLVHQVIEATVRTVTLLLTLCLSLTLSLLLTPPLPYASPYSQLLALGDGSAEVNQNLIRR